MGTVKSSNNKGEIKPQYDHKANYKWEPEDEFILTGEQFAMLLNTFRLQATTPGGAPAINIVDCHKVLEGLLITGVEEGVIKQVATEVINPTVEAFNSSTDEIPFIDLPGK